MCACEFLCYPDPSLLQDVNEFLLVIGPFVAIVVLWKHFVGKRTTFVTKLDIYSPLKEPPVQSFQTLSARAISFRRSRASLSSFFFTIARRRIRDK
jgi:hypothetical protein